MILYRVQVRRNDKKYEASFYSSFDYMRHVEEFYELYSIRHPARVKELKRVVYLATDSPSVISQFKRNHPNYLFVSNMKSAMNANKPTAKRNTLKAFEGFLLDVYFLSRAEFQVCTFSSNVCRLVYALAQATISRRTYDRSKLAVSLDTPYFFVPFIKFARKIAILDHRPSKHEADAEFQIGCSRDDIFMLTVDYFNGRKYSSTTFNNFVAANNLKSSKIGNVPSFKLKDFYQKL